REARLRRNPITDQLAAISVGIVSGEILLDLCYEEDSTASVDMNVAMTGSGKLVEVQGTAEGMPFSREKMNKMLDMAQEGINKLFIAQKQALDGILY
ncbi:MAG TPA: ribonuclease PH, partial [Armatimonadetes bacterium]|nr:ribonuclease PH [Armatimonadota bacterium]